ncbi:MAG: alpha amylase, catalytic region, partial [Chloroflexi bacterium]|nr:alpha amylase, catalytic region [Chloroflexota bacterium]
LIVEQYRRDRKSSIMAEALAYLDSQIGVEQIDKALSQFASDFPQTSVYRGELSSQEYMQGESLRPDGVSVPNRQIVLEETLMLWLANMNPAYQSYLELYDDEKLEKLSAYPEIVRSLQDFFATQPYFGSENQNLIDLLRAPALASPNSLTGQLEYIQTHWGAVLGPALQRLLLSSMDLVREEEKMRFGFPPAGAGGEAFVPEFTGQEYYEPEAFSQDLYWMPRLVLMAKNSFVWLDQLSRKYQRSITHLDQIPDEELDTLARWGVTGLWLIGLWERSLASKTIKQLRGNPEAVASAYSLMDYQIAQDLGGETAYRDLRERAWKRGIRLASDMVPNHMGIDSRWVIEHPDWFINMDYPPFPAYTFNGPNLSWDNRVGIYLEDHYYNNTDAAVVFKRVDFWTGSEKFIYHGNDGTSFPWNDTAQLNYLLPQVREAVIQTILQVARMFPVIRFDAAMTLAKRHYSRLWFPEPGRGGDIPSRAEFALTKEQFDAAFPEEFWREVVDRVAAEAPDTLLLAEAFWLMEGYFVRTLGMHRVYNSAFMNMLRDEKNQEYRLVIKNTLQFEPEILKRYVNFMNNPDERTAVDQFGKGDKYFGILTMLVTNPGLPMLGHGQVEGFTEKYGMEYRRAYYDETPDEWLVKRHEREIFPLMRKRYLFAEVANFLLYDFYVPEGYVNEDVYAYSNAYENERALVLYHNKYAETRGWIRVSIPFPVKTGESDGRAFIQKSLGEGLGLINDPNAYVIYMDQITGLEYLRNCQELFNAGLYMELKAYEHHVLLNFRVVMEDEERQYARLAEYLQGGGVPNIQETLQELHLRALLTPYRELVNSGWYEWVIGKRLHVEISETQDEPEQKSLKAEPSTSDAQPDQLQPFREELIAIEPVLEEGEIKALNVYNEVYAQVEGDGDPELTARQTRQDLTLALTLPAFIDWFGTLSETDGLATGLAAAIDYLQAGPGGKQRLQSGDPIVWGTLLSWVANHRLSQAAFEEDSPEQARSWMTEWLLGKINVRALAGLGIDEGKAAWQVELVKLLVGFQDWYQTEPGEELSSYMVLQSWLKDSAAQRYININRYQGILWFNKESFNELLWWMFTVAVLKIGGGLLRESEDPVQVAKAIQDVFELIKELQSAEKQSDFQVEKLLAAAKQ